VRLLWAKFGFRLGLTLGLTLLMAGALTYFFVSTALERESLRRTSALHNADARGLAHAVAQYRSRREWLNEAHEQLRGMGGREGVLEAILVDRRYRIVAAAAPGDVGRLDHTPRLVEAFRTGRAWTGHEADLRRNHRDFEFIRPITIHGAAYVFEITTAGETFEQQLSTIRRKLLIVGGLTFLAAGGLFWLIGGRRLSRVHDYALERATRDGLTDLPNHRAFHDELRRVGEVSARYGERVALLLLDLDGFKFENDRYGHRYGDDRLKTVAGVLRDSRGAEMAFRVGGDEFALLLPHAGAADARRAAERLRGRLAAEGVRVSVGAGELRRGQSPTDLREEVDAALYEAKRRGGDRVVLYDEVSDSVSVLTTSRSEAFDRLIAEEAIDIVFQPIWDLTEGGLLGVEALTRPRDESAFPGPAEAFDVAHQLGRVHELDTLCVRRALERAPELPDDVLLFLNVAPQSLDSTGAAWLVDAVASTQLAPDRVVIEVTERTGTRTAQVVQGIRHMRENGFAIAIDDVGSGNSGLEMLQETEAEYVKLDRAVVVGAVTDLYARGVVMAVTAFAHETGAFVIAEGIEDDDILHSVLTLGSRVGTPKINGGQGYGLGRPDARLPFERTNEGLLLQVPALAASPS
jgi:diguanylate cyclase (GGDEF)-like protein